MNKKGFTLVELLAVVVVLVIVSLISIPIVTGIIENVKKGAVKSSADGLLRAADMYYAKNMDKMKDPVEFEINDGVQVSKEKLDYNGNIKMGYLMLFSETKKAVCVDDGTYSAYKGVHDKQIKVIEGICTGEYDSETESYLVSQTSKGFTNLSIKSYTDASKLPNSGNTNDIAIITETKITGYYVSSVAPTTPEEGMVWVVQANNSPYYLESAYVRIGVSYAMQYESGKWILKHAYVYNDGWKLLYYVDMTDGNINLENSNLGEIKIENTYEYTGEYQEFTATFSGYYNVQLWGAQGGTHNTTLGGNGAYTAGDIYLNAGDTIYIYVGEQPTTSSGGWNGGGNGYDGSYHGLGGGGSTDIRLEKGTTWSDFESLKSRIMVAAGGGGASYYSSAYYSTGGPAGGLTGYISEKRGSSGRPDTYQGTGAEQSSGGFYYNDITLYNGGFGYGGASGTSSNGQGGGGSGYYGGGGGYDIGAGGGGSSYISGHLGCSSIDTILSTSYNSIVHTGSSYHDSGYYFKNTLLIDGKGYFWTSEIGSQIMMPTYDGTSTMTGNSGNGYAKIKLISIEQISEEAKKELRDNDDIYNYYYNGLNRHEGNYQIFTVPVDGMYKVELWGAQGGTRNSTLGGNGAYTRGETYLTKGTKLYIYVGGNPFTSTLGGYNGGGDGYNGSYHGRGGGGSTDIRLKNGAIWSDFESLKSRIMVAAGGGGASYYTSALYSTGGPAGGLIGYISESRGSNGRNDSYQGSAGTQSLGGYYMANTTLYNGGFGYGGASGTSSNGQGGGGSGYYGGGGGLNIGAGGGGSSYISGYEGCSSIDTKLSTNQEEIVHTGSAYHDSGYYFMNTEMLGNNNSGNGKAKITLLSNNDTLESVNYKKKYNYYYSGTTILSGRYQIFTVPITGTYKVELWGAQGGNHNATYPGGLGGYTSGEIELEKGTKLYLYLGSQVGNDSYKDSTGGWNGGGNGYNGSYNGRGGGGATDIRTIKTTSINLWNESDSLKSRIMVAAGGGGASYYNSSIYGNGGPAGGLIGYISNKRGGDGRNDSYQGTGGTQILGGFYNGNNTLYNGGFGYGGASGTSSNGQGGGGSGYYGGGGGLNIGAGGGGSSYISGHAGCIAVTSAGTPKIEEYSEISDSVSYTGYKFANTQMIDGSGYPWTTVKSEISSGMPSPTTSSIITGNSGNGYAKITYLGN